MYPSPSIQERYADGIVHIFGLVVVFVSCMFLIFYSAVQFDVPLIVACAIYVICMIASFAASASYHLLPQHHWGYPSKHHHERGFEFVKLMRFECYSVQMKVKREPV